MNMPQQTDKLYHKKMTTVVPFVFDENVVCVFDDMLNRSVPGYATILQQIPILLGDALTGKRAVYDLGCSLGGASFVLANMLHNVHHAQKVIAIDNSQAMIDALCAKIKNTTLPIEAVCQDITQVQFALADVVVMNFVLMFVPLTERVRLLSDIYNIMRPGGMLLVSEKIAPPDNQAVWMESMYHAYKRRQGYSQLEIEQKQAALAGVLVPETIETHEQRLESIGFHAHLWFRQWQFVSWLAVR